MNKYLRITVFVALIFIILIQEVYGKKVFPDEGGLLPFIEIDSVAVSNIVQEETDDLEKINNAIMQLLGEKGINMNKDKYPNNSNTFDKRFVADTKITVTGMDSDFDGKVDNNWLFKVKFGNDIFYPNGVDYSNIEDIIKKFDLPSEYNTVDKLKKYFTDNNTVNLEYDARLVLQMGATGSMYSILLEETTAFSGDENQNSGDENQNSGENNNLPEKEENDNDFTFPNSVAGDGGSIGTRIKNKIHKLFLEIKKNIHIWLLNILRGIADGVQILANTFVTANSDDIDVWKIMYKDDDYEKAVDIINSSLNESSNSSAKDNKLTINIEEKMEEDAEFPFIPVDSYNMAAGTIGAFDINFLKPELGKNSTLWMALRNIGVLIIRITIFVSSAILITFLILNGVVLTFSTLTPDKRKEHIEGLNKFATSLLMLLGAIVIMAIGIYSSDMFLKDIKDDYGQAFPITVSTQEGSSFKTNFTGYIRYMTQVDTEDSITQKTVFTFCYFILAEINIVLAVLMLVRFVIVLILSVLGPIIALLHILNLEDGFKMTYREWVTWYVMWLSIQLILAIIYRIIIKNMM